MRKIDYDARWRKKKESYKKPLVLKSYDEIVTFPNLYRAYKKARARKASKKEVMVFEQNLAENLWNLYDKLKERRWDEIFVYHRFFIQKPKPRKIDTLDFEGRIVQHLLCDNGIGEWFDRRLVKECAACRKGMGTHYAIYMAKQYFQTYISRYGTEGYILKIDIKKFFESIDHEVLKNKVEKINETSLKEFLFYIIDHTPETKGLPIGNQTSQWLALYYLDHLDRIIKEKYRCKYYIRYMDDLIIINNDKKFLQKMLKELAEVADNELHLTFNAKTQIVTLKQGFTFVGWRFKLDSKCKVIIKLNNAKRKETRSKVKEALYLHDNGQISYNKMLEKINSIVAHTKSIY